MMFTLWSKDVDQPDSTAWSEDYNEDVDDPRAWAEETLARFNATLRRGERPRVLLRVEVKPNDKPLKHVWHKTNLITIIVRNDNYDTYQCERCGMTAKRHGIGGDFIPDRKRDRGKSCKGANR